VLKGERPIGDKIESFTKVLRDHVTEQLGAIARPDDIRFADNLPKTRSGKIMRRLLRAIARNEDITQDLSTLENPAIIEQLRGNESAAAKPRAAAKATPVKKASAPKAPAKKATATKAPAKKAVARKPAAKQAAPKRKAAARSKPKKPAPKKQAVSKKKATKQRVVARRKK